jgi:transposase
VDVEQRMAKSGKPRRPRRQHSEEFKAGAVRLVLEEERSITSVAKDLDVQPSVLSSWVLQARADAGSGPPGALTSSEKEELARLRKENRILKMERDILKKAAAFFAKEST